MILRDHDANTAWASQADGTLESRTYICQNWRADVVALMTSGGQLINQVRYDPYGVPFGIAKPPMRLALDADGDVDNDDTTLFNTYYSGGTHPYADWNWDGTVDASDAADFLSDKNADSGLGRGDPGYAWSHAGGALRKAYAGYEIDPVLTGSEGWENIYHVRHRVYMSQVGRWTRRDPLGYVDGMSVFTYCKAFPARAVDPSGLRMDEVAGSMDCAILIMLGMDPDHCESDERRLDDLLREPLTPKQCCDAAERDGSGHGYSGALACCDGDPIPCVFVKKVMPGKDNDARKIGIHCTAVHECRHKLDQCEGLIGPCGSTPGWSPPPDTTDAKKACLECRAYKEHKQCLLDRMSQCETHDRNCWEDVGEEVGRVSRQIQIKCAECASDYDGDIDTEPPFSKPNPGDDEDTELDWPTLYDQPWADWCKCEVQ